MRGIDQQFLKAMREKLDHGRAMGRVGWDRHWERCVWPCPPMGPQGFLAQRLLQEVIELIVALEKNDVKSILSESADVANFAMMIADIHGALDKK